MTLARAFWTTAPGQGELRDEPLPAPGPGECRVRTLATGVSRGTEALVFAGRVPRSQYQAMRAPLMGGDFPFPVKYGYSAVGLIDTAILPLPFRKGLGGRGSAASEGARETGPEPHSPSLTPTPLQHGQRVFVLHPHQDRFNAPAAMCIPVPDNVPTHRAVLAANLETALNLLWDAAPLPGERIMVVGAGVIGVLAASLLARIPATTVTLIDTNPARATLAHAFGCGFALPDAAPANQELIVHTSASEAGLHLCLASAAFEARIIEASWYGDAAPALPLGEAFHARRLRLQATQVGHIAPPMRGRRTHAERLALALGLLTDARFDALLEGPTPFHDLPAAMPTILRQGGLCHVVSYDSPRPPFAGLGREERTKVEVRSAEGEGRAAHTAPAS
jgi:threonine dehydrogenase-like Zn-dependent dehydrogenase